MFRFPMPIAEVRRSPGAFSCLGDRLDCKARRQALQYCFRCCRGACKGSLQITEQYKLVDAGARHKSGFSRVEYQGRPGKNGAFSFKNLLARLPPKVHSVYYRDDVDNISSSRLRAGSRKIGKATFNIGYGIPMEDFLLESTDGRRYLNFSFGCPLAEIAVDKLTIKIVLPDEYQDISL